MGNTIANLIGQIETTFLGAGIAGIIGKMCKIRFRKVTTISLGNCGRTVSGKHDYFEYRYYYRSHARLKVCFGCGKCHLCRVCSTLLSVTKVINQSQDIIGRVHVGLKKIQNLRSLNQRII